MIRHQLKAEQLDFVAFQSFAEDSLKRLVIGLFAEDLGASIRSIQDMVQCAGFVGSGRSWHAGSLPNAGAQINES
jgi:hypothetical protein